MTQRAAAAIAALRSAEAASVAFISRFNTSSRSRTFSPSRVDPPGLATLSASVAGVSSLAASISAAPANVARARRSA